MGRLALVGSRGILCGYEASSGPSSEAVEQEEAGVCAGRGCTWRPPDQDQAAPPCFYPPGYGYHVAGEAVTTPVGLRVHLQKLGIYNTHSYPCPKMDLSSSLQGLTRCLEETLRMSPWTLSSRQARGCVSKYTPAT